MQHRMETQFKTENLMCLLYKLILMLLNHVQLKLHSKCIIRLKMGAFLGEMIG